MVTGILVRKVMPTSLVVGHAARGVAGDAVGVYHVSHVTVYRSPVMAAPAALHLAAHGPDHACQVNFNSISISVSGENHLIRGLKISQ